MKRTHHPSQPQAPHRRPQNPALSNPPGFFPPAVVVVPAAPFPPRPHHQHSPHHTHHHQHPAHSYPAVVYTTSNPYPLFQPAAVVLPPQHPPHFQGQNPNSSPNPNPWWK